MKLFISYSWDSEEHKNWVRQFTNDLIKNGIPTILDQYELKLGHNMKNFMPESISKADKILIILTENYKLKAENLTGGVGFEYSILREDLFSNIKNNDKIIPIIRQGNVKETMPVFLNQFLGMDMTSQEMYEEQLNLLVRELYNEPINKKPLLGVKPDFINSESYIIPSKTISDDKSTLDLYKSYIESLAKSKSEMTFTNSSRTHSVLVLESILRQSENNTMTIYLKKTDDMLYEDFTYVESLKNFALNSKNKLNLIISDKSKINESSILGKLIFTLNSLDNVSLRFLANDIFPEYINFAVSESNAFRIETEDQGKFNAIAGFNNKEIVDKLIARLNK